MTYGQEARRKFGLSYYYWLKGWRDYENFRQMFRHNRLSDFDEAAYLEGYKTRSEITRQTCAMLVEQ